jgi:Signal transduction histidine kinase involved in nitrogen fixation and metabolism regulation
LRRSTPSKRSHRFVTIESRLHDATGEIEIVVLDSGSGVPSAIAAKIFEPLFTTKGQGMGMGLELSRTIIEAHGGRLWTDVRPPSGGAVFHFTVRPA